MYRRYSKGLSKYILYKAKTIHFMYIKHIAAVLNLLQKLSIFIVTWLMLLCRR